jgi:putative transposase
MNPQPPPPRRHRTRHELPGHARFLTFSCYRNLPLLQTEATRDILDAAILQSRETLHFKLYAWVIMPNHVHMLLKPDLPEHPVPTILKRIKQPAARKILTAWRKRDAPVIPKITDPQGKAHFWQRGGYDRNIISKEEFIEKLNYIHLNPVKAELVKRPEEWKWSSGAAYNGKPRPGFEPDPLPRM